jgi:hypothetical protein
MKKGKINIQGRAQVWNWCGLWVRCEEGSLLTFCKGWDVYWKCIQIVCNRSGMGT